MLITAIVVEDFGITPSWWGSITFNTAGLTYVFTRNSSAILEMHEVREIGLRSFVSCWMIFVFGRGYISLLPKSRKALFFVRGIRDKGNKKGKN